MDKEILGIVDGDKKSIDFGTVVDILAEVRLKEVPQQVRLVSQIRPTPYKNLF